MTANVWNPGQGAIPVAQSKQTMLSQSFDATEAQVLFNLTAFNYEVNTSSLLVAINGVMQVPGVDFAETSNSSFTVDTPLKAGDKVLALGFVGVTATDASLTAISLVTKGYRDNALTYQQAAANSATAASDSATAAANSKTGADTAKTGAETAKANTDTVYNNTVGVYNNTVSVSSAALEGMRNRVINGDMRIDQRANFASVAFNSSNNGLKCADRWNFSMGGTGAWTGQVVVDGPNYAFKNSLKVTVTTAAAQANDTTGIHILHPVEKFLVADAEYGSPSTSKQFTTSFFVKSSVVGKYSIFLYHGGGVGQLPRTIVNNFTINAANTWEYKTITWASDPSAATWLSIPDNGLGFYIGWDLGSGTGRSSALSTNTWRDASPGAQNSIVRTNDSVNWISTAGATFQLTHVQHEIGTAATAFQRRPYSLELLLCQRYYYQARQMVGVIGSANAAWRMSARHPTPMRVAPSTNLVGLPTVQIGSLGSTTMTGIANNYSTVHGLEMDITITNSGTGGQPCIMYAQNGDGHRVDVSAEL